MIENSKTFAIGVSLSSCLNITLKILCGFGDFKITAVLGSILFFIIMEFWH